MTKLTKLAPARIVATVGAAVIGLLVTLPVVLAAPGDALGKGQYVAEADAKASCPADKVVWVNLTSRIFHPDTSRSYGKTKRGAYMCEKAAAAEGYRSPKPRVAARSGAA
ncbi:MAG: hypothetical protein IT537_23240 [Hyphomicrobiales bacterium]|nr:hypothetical protein [Hyphomicrobiales bacterium]